MLFHAEYLIRKSPACEDVLIDIKMGLDAEDAEDTVPGRNVSTGKNGPGVQNGC